MINRWIGIATLGLMLSVNAALVVRDFLPDWMAGEPPRSCAFELRNGQETNVQFGLYDRAGRRIGHSWTYSNSYAGLISVEHRTVIDASCLPMETELQTVRIETRLNFREQGQLDELRVHVFGLGPWIKLQGEFFPPDDFPCQWQVGAQRGEFQLPAHVTRAMGDFIRPFDSLTGLHVGQSWRMKLVNPLSGLVPDWGGQNMTTSGLLVRVTKTETIEHRGANVDAFVVEAGSIRAWVTPAGRVIRQEFELPLLGMLLLVEEPFDPALRGESTRGRSPDDVSLP